MAESNTDTSQGQPEWQIEQYEAGLAHLEGLQEQIEHLRSTLPSLVAPLVQPHSSRAQMFAEVKKSAIASTNDLKKFSDDWNSEQTNQILARVKESESRDGDLARASNVSMYGWQERQQESSHQAVKRET